MTTLRQACREAEQEPQAVSFRTRESGRKLLESGRVWENGGRRRRVLLRLARGRVEGGVGRKNGGHQGEVNNEGSVSYVERARDDVLFFRSIATNGS